MKIIMTIRRATLLVIAQMHLLASPLRAGVAVARRPITLFETARNRSSASTASKRVTTARTAQTSVRLLLNLGRHYTNSHLHRSAEP